MKSCWHPVWNAPLNYCCIDVGSFFERSINWCLTLSAVKGHLFTAVQSAVKSERAEEAHFSFHPTSVHDPQATHNEVLYSSMNRWNRHSMTEQLVTNIKNVYSIDDSNQKGRNCVEIEPLHLPHQSWLWWNLYILRCKAYAGLISRFFMFSFQPPLD